MTRKEKKEKKKRKSKKTTTKQQNKKQQNKTEKRAVYCIVFGVMMADSSQTRIVGKVGRLVVSSCMLIDGCRD